jgi:serine/threonine protein kinase
MNTIAGTDQAKECEMKYNRPAEEEKSDDSLFIRGSDDDDEDDDEDDRWSRSRHEDETLLSLTPPTNTTIRERHYSFAEHQEELSPGGRYNHHLNSHQQQQQQQQQPTPTTTHHNSITDTSASAAASSGPPRMRIPTTTSLSSTSSSTDLDEPSLPAHQNDRHAKQPQLHHHDSDANYSGNNIGSSGSFPHAVPADQERQILLLMLLAQVCALHDPTPRTFTVHVLELFERGILDRHSIHFLFDLGLVPSSSSLSPPHNNLLMASPSPAAGDLKHQQQQKERALSSTKLAIHEETASSATITSRSSTDDENKQRAMVTTTRRTQMTYQLQRSLEASAIRSTLEQQEEEEQQRQMRKVAAAAAAAASPPPRMATATSTCPQNASPSPTVEEQQPRTSWSVEHHPLSLSRYVREFDEIVLLSSGSFGQVFHAKNKMDLRDYAIKRIPFAATGYSRDSVQQVVREVQCLAVCDHPNVVRYYTSWLEPTWPGSGISNTATGINDIGGGGGGGGKGIASKQKLLQDITHLVEGTGGCENLTDDLEAYFIDTGAPRVQQQHHHHRHFSVDASSDSSNSWISDQDFVDGEEYSDDWTSDDANGDRNRRSSKDDAFRQDLYRPGRTRSDSRSNEKRHQNHDISSSSDAGQWKPLHQQQKRQHRQHKGRRHKTKQNESFRYQICLFIQMQLCHPRSLADWIQERNRSALTLTTTGASCAKRRLETAAVIFSQITHGLGHVHRKGIIHRDMKPSNGKYLPRIAPLCSNV